MGEAQDAGRRAGDRGAAALLRTFIGREVPVLLALALLVMLLFQAGRSRQDLERARGLLAEAEQRTKTALQAEQEARRAADHIASEMGRARERAKAQVRPAQDAQVPAR